MRRPRSAPTSRRREAPARCHPWTLWLLCAAACGDAEAGAEPESARDAPDAAALSIEALQDPRSCEPCHAQHYREWASSMHAYAAQDPVFIAMNERGQSETDGALGDFCVQCHAPMALALGLTQDGLNLPDVDDPNARGVTCYFCHDVTAVAADHNAGLVLAHDGVMRAGLGGGARSGARAETANAAAPLANAAHASEYSALHDGGRRDSAALCGACHDVVNHNGAAIERTFAEWRSSAFAETDVESEVETCASCHMPGHDGQLAADGPPRTLHRHLWAGVDVALEPSFPGLAAQAAAIECALAGAIELAIAPASAAFDRFEVTLTNRGVGHAWPSGAAQDRRAWVEFVARDADGAVLLQSGVVADGEVVGALEPDLQVLRDRLHDERGAHVHMFWQAAASADHPLGYESDLLPPISAQAPSPTRTFRYVLPAPAARVTARLRLQAIGLDVLDDFQGLTLPITERVLQNGYVQSNTLRSRVRTITVPGTERSLALEDGQVVAATEEAAPSGCDEQRYAGLLDANGGGR